MGLLKLLKWILIFAASITLVSMLFVVPFTLSFAELTKPEAMKPIFFSIMASMPEDEAKTSQLEAQIRYDCQNRKELQLPLGDGSENITINCDDIRNNRTLNEAILDDLFDKIYYADYDCKFLECFSRQEKGEFPSFIFSKLANEFFTATSREAIIVTIILVIALILLGGIRAVAKNLVIAGLPFIFLLIGRDSILQQISQNSNFNPLLPLFTSLTDISMKIFGIFLAAGIILFLLSFIFRKKMKKPEAAKTREAKKARPAKRQGAKRKQAK